MMVWRLLILMAVFSGVAQGSPTADQGYLWRAELDGPTQRCKVPPRILFVMADAIIGGKIKFGGVTYYPNGRIETESRMETSFSLIRFSGDKRPLVTITAIADGNWNGTWTARGAGCSGKARVVSR
jgi:hypothetical protein